SHSGTPFGVGTSHGHFGPQDTPRPELGSMPPPYSLYQFCLYHNNPSHKWKCDLILFLMFCFISL
ncbi:unnamed protein product, partial [Sphagnum jensenii]